MKVVIIGSGSGAFAAAIQATSSGADVDIIESDTLGGTCVNVGCVPSKIFIRAAEAAHAQSSHPFSGLGKVAVTLDRRSLTRQQQARVDELRQAKYENILASNTKIHLIRGTARFQDAHTLIIDRSESGTQLLKADRILVATGSRPFIPAIPGLHEVPYWTSTEALQTEIQPTSLIVIGGSVIALELAQAYARLGTRVTVLARSTLLSHDDPDIGVQIKAAFESEGINVITHVVPSRVVHDGTAFQISLPNGSVITAEQLLVAAGRHANLAALNIAAAGVALDVHGNICIDDEMRTNVPHIYAAGDCTNQPQYVYVAAAAGSRAAANMLGRHTKLDLSIMPAVVFTDPQVATIGLTEAQARANGIDAQSRLLTLDNVPRALVSFNTRGFIKLVMDKQTGVIVGAQIVAHEGSEAIQTIAVAMKVKMTVKDLSRMLFPYLTMVEGLKLCAQTFSKDVSALSCCADTGVDDDEEPAHGCCASQSPSTASTGSGLLSRLRENPIGSVLLVVSVIAVGAFIFKH
tara:strand:- start:433 stop:1992 length:1560 start_codon:yes stop_codon:yes gene_type:complete